MRSPIYKTPDGDLVVVPHITLVELGDDAVTIHTINDIIPLHVLSTYNTSAEQVMADLEELIARWHMPRKSSKPSDGDVTPYDDILHLYHTLCPDMPRLQVWSDARRSLVRARWQEHPGLDRFEEYFARAARQPFLSGKTGGSWKADFEWLMNPTNFAKVLEMRYSRNGS